MLDSLGNRSEIIVITAFSLTPKTVHFDLQIFRVDPKNCQTGLLISTGKGSYDPHLEHPRDTRYYLIHSEAHFQSHCRLLT